MALLLVKPLLQAFALLWAMLFRMPSPSIIMLQVCVLRMSSITCIVARGGHVISLSLRSWNRLTESMQTSGKGRSLLTVIVK